MDTLLIVTGGSSGLGRALLAAAPPGTHRIDVSRSGPPDVAEGHIEADLSDPAAWSRVGDVLEAVVGERSWERITFVHSAGTIAPIGFAGEVPDADYTRNVLLNTASGPVLGHRFLAAVRRLDARRELVLVSSGAARSSYPGWATYGAAKAAGDQWVRTVGEEQRHRGGVRVLSVAPGVVATDMQAAIRDTTEHDFPAVERFRRLHEDGQLEDADDVARRFWELLEDVEVETGEVTDLRSRR
jgi:benzil reductase ((S)-benzoin forming)